MERLLFLLCLIPVSLAAPAGDRAAPAAAPKPAATVQAAPAPDVEAVIDRYLQALGGRAALEKITSRLTRSSIIPGEGESITLEVYWKAPDRWLQVIGVPEDGLMRSGFDGKVGWTQDSQGRVRELKGTMLATVRYSGAFFQQSRFRDLYPRRALKGPGKVGDRPAWIIEATRADGNAETLYFDRDSGLLLRRDLLRPGPNGQQATQISYEEYRVVDGVRIPFLSRQRRGPSTPALTIKVNEVRQNVPVDDAKFSKPS
jgi:zinc protease